MNRNLEDGREPFPTDVNEWPLPSPEQLERIVTTLYADQLGQDLTVLTPEQKKAKQDRKVLQDNLHPEVIIRNAKFMARDEQERRLVDAKNREASAISLANRQIDNAKTVYFMQSGYMIKIGIATDPEQRLYQLRRGDDTIVPLGVDRKDIRIIATEKGGMDREQELHKEFAHLRLRGEWFAIGTDLEAYIEALSTSELVGAV